jgi:tape measure domain-containing protein
VALNLGDINFGITPQMGGLHTAMQTMLRFGNVVNQAFTQAGAGAQAFARQMASQEAAALRAMEQVRNFQQRARTAGAPDAFVNTANQALNAYTRQMSQATLGTLGFHRANEDLRVNMGNLNRLLREHITAQNEAEKGTGKFGGALKNLHSASVLFSGPLSGLASRFAIMNSLMASGGAASLGMVAGLAAAAYAFIKLGGEVIRTEVALTKIRQQYDIVTGAQALTQAAMADVMGIANRAGIQFETTALQFGRLSIAAKDTSLEGEKVRALFEVLAFATSKLGLSAEQTEGALRAFEQMISKGKIQSEELRGQLSERLPGAFKIAAQAMNMTTQELDKALKKGTVYAEDFLPKMTEAMKKAYNIDVTANIDNIVASQNRYKNSVLQLVDAIDKAIGFSTGYKNSLDLGVKALDWFTTALGGTSSKMAGALPDVEEYINAQKTLGTATRNTTNALILQQQTILELTMEKLRASQAEYQAQIDASKNRGMVAVPPPVQINTGIIATLKGYYESVLAAVTFGNTEVKKEASKGWIDSLPTAEEAQRLSKNAQASWVAASPPSEAEKRVREFEEAIAKLHKRLDDLARLNNESVNREAKRIPKPPKNEKLTEELDDLKEKTKAAKDELEAMNKSAQDLREWKFMKEINDSIDKFVEKLKKAGMEEEAAKKATEGYRDALTKLKRAQEAATNTTSLHEFAAKQFGKAGETAVDKFVDALKEGQMNMEVLRDIGKSVAADLLKEFMKLALLAPLKNWLFGTNSPVLGSGPGGGAIGQLLNFHTGGFVGENTSPPKFDFGNPMKGINNTFGFRDVAAVLEKGETVLTRGQTRGLMALMSGRNNRSAPIVHFNSTINAPMGEKEIIRRAVVMAHQEIMPQVVPTVMEASKRGWV